MYYSKNLEIHIVDHCNFDCIGCSHESPLMNHRNENLQVLEDSLQVLWKYYQAPLIKIIGGEPLLHPEIDKIVSAVKAITGSRIRCVTNGSLLTQKYTKLKGIDEIHISSYPHSKEIDDRQLQDISMYLAASITVQRFDFFRWHRSSQTNNYKLTDRIFRACQIYHSWQCQTLREGWIFPCPPAATWSCAGARDGINLLEPDSEISSRIENLFKRRTAFESCKNCLGSVGKIYEHKQGWRNEEVYDAYHQIDMDFLVELEADIDTYNKCFQYEKVFYPNGTCEVLK